MTGINCSAGEIANGWQPVPLARDPTSDSHEPGHDASVKRLVCPPALGDSGTGTGLRGWSPLLSAWETREGLERILKKTKNIKKTKRILSGIPFCALFCSTLCMAVTQVPAQSLSVAIRDAQEVARGGAGFDGCPVLAPLRLSLSPSRYFNT